MWNRQRERERARERERQTKWEGSGARVTWRELDESLASLHKPNGRRATTADALKGPRHQQTRNIIPSDIKHLLTTSCWPAAPSFFHSHYIEDYGMPHFHYFYYYLWKMGLRHVEIAITLKILWSPFFFKCQSLIKDWQSLISGMTRGRI